MKQRLSKEFLRMQKLAGIINEGTEFNDASKKLANEYYNLWLSEYDPSDDYGDSTTFSGSDDDIINGNYDLDNDYPNAIGYAVPESATVFVTQDEGVAADIKKDFASHSKLYSDSYNYIVVVF